jgi:hypothetical protein
MGLSFSVKLAPGVRVRASSRGAGGRAVSHAELADRVHQAAEAKMSA